MLFEKALENCYCTTWLKKLSVPQLSAALGGISECEVCDTSSPSQQHFRKNLKPTTATVLSTYRVRSESISDPASVAMICSISPQFNIFFFF